MRVFATLLLWSACGLAAAAPDLARLQWSTEVFFDHGSAQLRVSAQAALDQAFNQAAKLDPEVIMAIGHTDARLSGVKSQRLSIARAEAVKAYLAGRGFERNRIYTEGKGKRIPSGSNASLEGRAQNNRVDVQLVGKRIYWPGQED